MPSCCDLWTVLTHPDKTMRDRLVSSYRRGGVAQEFLPVAKRYLHGEAYARQREAEWGTEEDFGEGECSAAPVCHDDRIELHFETVNGPPLGVFVELRRLGFSVEADYRDPGSGFCGYPCGGRFDESRILCWNPACICRHLDPNLVKLFGIDDGHFHDGKACSHGSESWSISRGRTLERYFCDRSKITRAHLKGWERAFE
jgi:hypothetical protein